MIHPLPGEAECIQNRERERNGERERSVKELGHVVAKEEENQQQENGRHYNYVASLSKKN
jgi:hypothetical protein